MRTYNVRMFLGRKKIIRNAGDQKSIEGQNIKQSYNKIQKGLI